MALALALLAIGGVLVTGCGGSSTSAGGSSTSAGGSSTSASGSGKPAYCSAISDLENTIKALPTTSVLTNGTKALTSTVSRVQNDVKAVVTGAENEFASQTSALKTSVDALSSTATHIVSSPTAPAIGQLPAQVAAVSSAAKKLATATAPKCG